jgi:hypothetical protein
MRVDALFLAGGEHGGPASPRQLLLALRNVEVISSEEPSYSGRGSFPQRTTLRLTAEQLRKTRDLPPAIAKSPGKLGPVGLQFDTGGCEFLAESDQVEIPAATEIRGGEECGKA